MQEPTLREGGERMLEIVRSMGALDFEELMAVYRESNAENAQEQDIPIAQVEQNFADYLREDFFRQKGAFYCLWKENGRTVSALRLEPFEDGLLLEALETMPEQRRRGYGKALVLAALDHVRNEYGKPVYSHVWRRNHASMALHAACGFTQVLDYAKLIDGSVNTSHVTLKCL